MRREIMKQRILGIMLCTMGLLASAQHGPAQEERRDRGDFQERDEFRQSYKLAAGAQVEVRNINGPLQIETTDGDQAEVYVTRSARTRADLDYCKVIVDNDGGVFRVYTEEPPEEIRGRVSVRHNATVKV